MGSQSTSRSGVRLHHWRLTMVIYNIHYGKMVLSTACYILMMMITEEVGLLHHESILCLSIRSKYKFIAPFYL